MIRFLFKEKITKRVMETHITDDTIRVYILSSSNRKKKFVEKSYYYFLIFQSLYRYFALS